MRYLTACPVCQDNRFQPYLTCIDHTVSHETFQLEKCATCGLVLTNPRPDDHDLPRYYLSDAYISHADKSHNLIDQVYKLARRFTLKWKIRILRKYSAQEPRSVLDYGCGTGTFLRECKRNGLTIAGVEPSPVAAATAKQQNRSAQITGTIQDIKGHYDVITLWHVLEHVGDLHETIASLRDHLDGNGTMFIAVPNLQSQDAKTYGPHWAAYDVPRHLWHFSKSTMQRVLEYHKLKLINVVPMRLDAYYVSLLSEKYQSQKSYGIYSTIQAMLNGLRSNIAAKNSREFSSLIYIARK